MYTTNSIESYNRLLRKVTTSKSVFPSDDALHKSLYFDMSILISTFFIRSFLIIY
ncbi:MAG: hypothetical protein RSB12_00905, partial [Peptostreptococcaceae bacterium]